LPARVVSSTTKATLPEGGEDAALDGVDLGDEVLVAWEA
jgi:hypothetical protein